jgi:hypothetical protein
VPAASTGSGPASLLALQARSPRCSWRTVSLELLPAPPSVSANAFSVGFPRSTSPPESLLGSTVPRTCQLADRVFTASLHADRIHPRWLSWGSWSASLQLTPARRAALAPTWTVVLPAGVRDSASQPARPAGKSPSRLRCATPFQSFAPRPDRFRFPAPCSPEVHTTCSPMAVACPLQSLDPRLGVRRGLGVTSGCSPRVCL